MCLSTFVYICSWAYSAFIGWLCSKLNRQQIYIFICCNTYIPCSRNVFHYVHNNAGIYAYVITFSRTFSYRSCSLRGSFCGKYDDWHGDTALWIIAFRYFCYIGGKARCPHKRMSSNDSYDVSFFVYFSLLPGNHHFLTCSFYELNQRNFIRFLWIKILSKGGTYENYYVNS